MYDELDEISLNNKLKEFRGSLKCLNSRTDLVGDINNSLKQRNRLIKKDLEAEFAAIETQLKAKQVEITGAIKNFLEKHFNDVKQKQIKLKENIKKAEELEAEISVMTNEDNYLILVKLNELNELINSINEGLESIAESNTGNGFNIGLTSDRKTVFLENNLYPQFDYLVDTSKLLKDINDLEVNISDLNSKTVKKIFGDNRVFQLKPEDVYYCAVTTNLNTDGTFCIKLLGPGVKGLDEAVDSLKINEGRQQVDSFIDEVDKYIKRKRVAQVNWSTFDELQIKPEINQKCFCMERSRKKWLRAQVVNYNAASESCQTYLIDEGKIDPTWYSLKDIMVWNEMELTQLPALGVKCALFKSEKKIETNIGLEAKCKFRDLSTEMIFKCEFISQVIDENENIIDPENPTWMVKLYVTKDDSGSEENAVFNKLIIETNESYSTSGEIGGKTIYRSYDIRLENGTVNGKCEMTKTKSNDEIITRVDVNGDHSMPASKSQPTISTQVSDTKQTTKKKQNKCSNQPLCEFISNI